MSCPSPFSLFDLYHDIFYLGLFPDFCASDFVSYCDVKHPSFHCSLCCGKFLFRLVVVHVFLRYVIVGITHWVYILLLRDIGSFQSQSISLNLPKQLHPAFILIITSSRVWFSIITIWPRYLYLSTFSIIVSSDWKLVIYFVFPLCMLSPIFLLPWFSSLSCTSISFTDVAIRATSTANLRSVNFSVSTFSPLSWRFSFLNISAIAVINILGEIVSPCLTPLSMLIVFEMSFSVWMFAVASV